MAFSSSFLAFSAASSASFLAFSARRSASFLAFSSASSASFLARSARLSSSLRARSRAFSARSASLRASASARAEACSARRSSRPGSVVGFGLRESCTIAARFASSRTEATANSAFSRRARATSRSSAALCAFAALAWPALAGAEGGLTPRDPGTDRDAAGAPKLASCVCVSHGGHGVSHGVSHGGARR